MVGHPPYRRDCDSRATARARGRTQRTGRGALLDGFDFSAFGEFHDGVLRLRLQTPHNTAVLVERATRIEWVVDMWPRGYLQPPDVMTVEKWVKED